MKIRRYIPWIIVLAALAVSIFLLSRIYPIIDQRKIENAQSKEEYIGDIETPGKKILNGYLGTFFRFKQLGNINWPVIPLLIVFLVASYRRKKNGKGPGLQQWHKALLFSWAGLLLFLSIKGYANPRYQLSLFPINTAMVFYLLWKLLENRSKYLRAFCFGIVAAIAVFNIYHYAGAYKTMWDKRIALQNPHFPQKMLDFIETSPDIHKMSRVFVINQPIFYYHTSKYGADSMSAYVVEPWVLLRKKTGDRQKAFSILKFGHLINYFLLNTTQKRFFRDTTLEEFLQCECKLFMEDNGWLLYKLRDNLLEDRLKAPDFRQVPVWNTLGTGREQVCPFLFSFNLKGKTDGFDIRALEEEKGKHILVMRNVGAIDGAAREKEKKRLDMGLDFNRQGLQVTVSPGDYVYVLVEASISPQLDNNRSNFMMLADRKAGKKKEWDRVKMPFTTYHWRTYFLEKKIRPGAQRVVVLFRFTPQTPADRLMIRDVKIFISKKEL